MDHHAPPEFSVLLVEDDVRLARMTAEYLEDHGISVVSALDGEQALDCLGTCEFDVVLLDLMLPGRDGLSICAEIRTHSDVPVLMLTARDGEDERVLGLETGADDYIVKPFSARELLARVRAHARRRRGLMTPPSELIEAGPIVLDPQTMTATLRDAPLSLTAYEFSLLKALAEEPGRVLTRDQLLERAKGSASEAFDRSIDVRISRLRQKLGDEPRAPQLLLTVRGVGYRLATDN